MKSDYRLRAEKFIAQVFPFIVNCIDSPHKCEKSIYDFNMHYSRHVIVAHGAARIALITSDYVVKFEYSTGADRYGGCEDEVSFYNFAKEKGFAHLFAEITPFCYRGHMFYIMPLIEDVERTDSFVQEYLNDEDLDFVDTYLYDMHSGNYGWKNDYPVIIDYALNIFFDERVRKEEEEEEGNLNSTPS